MFGTKDTVPLKTVPAEKALAVAFAAQRINKDQYIKHTRRFSEEENKTVFSNKEIVKYYFNPSWRQLTLLRLNLQLKIIKQWQMQTSG